jgi:putative sugar O-methyltransferase
MLKPFAKKISRILANHPRMLFRLQQRWLKVGHNILDLRMAAWVIRRPEWLREGTFDNLKLIEDPLPVDANASLIIARRLLRSHAQTKLASNDAIPQDSIWGVLLESHYSELIKIVSNGDERALAEFLSVLFRTETVDGYTYGSTFNSWPHRWHYLTKQIELSVVQLAEAVGLVRAECHEQGEVAFWRKLTSEEDLIEGLEAFFGFRIEQPRVGDPRGIMFGGRFLTRETCSHLHSAYKMSLAIERNAIKSPLNVVEIGGGFGGTSYWLRKLLADRIQYQVIVDLPEVNLVQAYFLGMCLPDKLILTGEKSEGVNDPILLISYDELSQIKFRPNIVINQDSMPEMPVAEVNRYFEWISENLDGVFISFNQEALATGGADMQVWVPSIAARFGRLKRVSRETSWDRRGYVEEVYITQ